MHCKFISSQLSNIEVFSSLENSDFKEVSKYLTIKKYNKNQSIINNLDKTTDVYFIINGSVRATSFSLTGKEIAYQDLFKNEMFGELSAIDGGSRTTSIVTLEASEIGRMSASDFKTIIQKYPCINEKVMHRLTNLIRFLCGRIYEFSVLDVKDRIRAEIIRHARQSKDSENSALITKMPTHEEIANKVSTHREAVTKEFGQLMKLGLIEKSGRKIIVPDIDKLAATLLEEV